MGGNGLREEQLANAGGKESNKLRNRPSLQDYGSGVLRSL